MKRIENKLDEIDKRLRKIEGEFFDELSEDELRGFEENLKTYREYKLEMMELDESERDSKLRIF